MIPDAQALGQDSLLYRNIASIQNDSIVKVLLSETYGRLIRKADFSTKVYYKYSFSQFSKITMAANYTSEMRQELWQAQKQHSYELIDTIFLDSIPRGYKQKVMGVFFVSYPYNQELIIEFQLIATFYGYKCSKLISAKRLQLLFQIGTNGELFLKNYCVVEKVNECRFID